MKERIKLHKGRLLQIELPSGKLIHIAVEPKGQAAFVKVEETLIFAEEVRDLHKADSPWHTVHPTAGTDDLEKTENAGLPVLRLGRLQPSPGRKELKRRKDLLKACVERYDPDLVGAVKRAEAAGSITNQDGVLALPQDSYASNYDMDEYTLLGMAAKYAGMVGLQAFMLTGTNSR